MARLIERLDAAIAAWTKTLPAKEAEEILEAAEVPSSRLYDIADCAADQISIEAAQPKLDLGMLKDLSSKTIMLGVIDLGDRTVEAPGVVADRIRTALKHVDALKLVVAPDCGMKYLSRDVAFGKLQAMAKGAEMVRGELG